MNIITINAEGQTPGTPPQKRLSEQTEHLPKHGINIQPVTLNNTNSIKLSKGKGKANKAFRWLGIPDAYITWLPTAEKTIEKILKEKSIDAIMTSTPYHTSTIIGYRETKKHQIPHIIEYRDPWIGAPQFKPPTKIHRKHEKRLQNKIDTHATQIIHISEPQKQKYLKEYPNRNPEKIHVVPHGYDPKDYNNIKTARNNRKHQIAYIGTILPNYDLSFLEDIPITKKITFAGRIAPNKARKIARYPNTENLGKLKRKKALQITANADLLIFSLSNQPEYSNTISTRIYEYIALGKDILAITDPEGPAAKLIKSTNSGTVVAHGDHEKIREEIIKKRPPRKKNLEPLEPYKTKNRMKKLAKIIKETEK